MLCYDINGKVNEFMKMFFFFLHFMTFGTFSPSTIFNKKLIIWSFCIINEHKQSLFVTISLSLSYVERTEWTSLDCLVHFLIFSINKKKLMEKEESVFNKKSYNLKDEKAKRYLQNLILC